MVIYWIIIGILVLLALVFLKFDHGARKVKLIALVLIALLLYFSISGVFSSDNIDLKSPKGIVSGVYVYFGWLGKTAGNLWGIGVSTGKTVGNAVKINSTENPK